MNFSELVPAELLTDRQSLITAVTEEIGRVLIIQRHYLKMGHASFIADLIAADLQQAVKAILASDEDGLPMVWVLLHNWSNDFE